MARRLAGFPENERAKAAEAMQLYKDATRLLERLVAEKVACCKAIYGFFPAHSEGDTIRIGDYLLPTLRQQVKRPEAVYKSLADFMMPAEEQHQQVKMCGAELETASKRLYEAQDVIAQVHHTTGQLAILDDWFRQLESVATAIKARIQGLEQEIAEQTEENELCANELEDLLLF